MGKELIFKVAQKTRALWKPEKNGLLINALYIWGANMLPGLFGALFWWLTSRYFSPSEIGLASAIISASAMLAFFSRLGMDISLIRFLPDSEEPKYLVNTVLSYIGLFSLIITSIFIVAIPLLSPKLYVLIKNWGYLLGFFLLTSFTALMGALRAVYVAQRSANYSLYTSLIVNISRLMVIFFIQVWGVIGIIFSVFSGIGLSTITGIRRYVPAVVSNFRPQLIFNWEIIRKILPYSLGNLISDFVIQIPELLLPLMILNALGEVSNGHAYVALMISGMLTSLGLALGRSAFAEGSNRITQAHSILRDSAMIGAIVTIPIAGFVVFMAPWLLGFFGPSYVAEASGLLRWIACSSPIIVLLQLFYTRLRLNKEVKFLIGLCLLNTFVIVFATATGLKPLGVSAAGIGVFIGNLIPLLVVTIPFIKTRKMK